MSRNRIATVVLVLVVLIGATFTTAYASFTVTLRADPEEGGTVTGGGTYTDGSNVDILATPAAGYTFVGWYREDETEPFTTDPNYTYEQESDRTYIARFEKAVSVDVVAQPAEGGSVTQSGDGNYVFDESVTVTAVPSDNYAFIGWFDSSSTSDPVSVDKTYTFNVSDSVSLIAKFSAQYSLKVNIEPEDTGTVTGSGSFAGGSIVTIQAIPFDGYRFIEWEDASAGGTPLSSDEKYSFNLDDSMVLTAKFGRSYGYILLRVAIWAAVAVAALLIFLFFRRRLRGSGVQTAEGSPQHTRRFRWRWPFRRRP